MKKQGWKELPEGDILAPGTAANFKTGDWRSERPVWDSTKCKHDLMCWVYCPDSAIITKDGKMCGINYDHCKGCGICAHVCPLKEKAIKMEPEEKFRQGK
ncbi:MAG: 4Fe-4S binding protein [Elusimicrobiota bacterium]